MVNKMAEKEWIEIGPVIGDTGSKGDTGDIGIGTIIKGHYNNYSEFISVHPSGSLGDAYIVDGSYYYWNENGWANAGSVKGDTGETGAKGDKGDKGDTGAKGNTGKTGPKGDTGDTGAGVTIKGSYNTYAELIAEHPTGDEGDSYLVNGFLYVWNGTAWENVGNIKGEKGETGQQGVKGDTGDTGASGFSPIVNVDHSTGQIVITTEDGSATISFDELKGDTGPQGVKGDTGNTGDAFTFDDFTPEQLASLKGDTGDTGATGSKGDKGDKGDTGQGSDEEAGWKLPVDKIQTTTTLPTGVSKGYRVAICTSSVMAIKEYNGSSWDTESLDPYSVIPLKHTGSIQMYLAKASGPVYMGVDYGVFGKFRFMTQAAYDALSSYDEDTIYFVRS